MPLSGYWPMRHHDPQHTACSPNSTFYKSVVQYVYFTGIPMARIDKSLPYLVMDADGAVYTAAQGSDAKVAKFIKVTSTDPNQPPAKLQLQWAVSIPPNPSGRWSEWANHAGLFALDGSILLCVSPEGPDYPTVAYFINTATGEILSSYTLENSVNTRGFTLFGNTIFGYEDYEDRVLYAWNFDGTLIWAKDVRDAGYSYWRIYGALAGISPLISPSGNVLVSLMDTWPAGRGAAVCLDSASGDVLWVFQPGDVSVVLINIVGPDGTVYSQAKNKEIQAISASGTLLWKTNFGTPDYWKSPMALGPSGLYIDCLDENLVRILDPATGTVLRTYSGVCDVLSCSSNDPSSGDPEHFFIGSGTTLTAYVTSTGEMAWSANNSSGFKKPVVGPDKLIYTADIYGSAGLIYLGDASPTRVNAVCTNVLIDAHTDAVVTIL